MSENASQSDSDAISDEEFVFLSDEGEDDDRCPRVRFHFVSPMEPLTHLQGSWQEDRV